MAAGGLERRLRWLPLAVFVLVMPSLIASPALAQRTEAAQVFEEGLAAGRSGDHATAARHFYTADLLWPHPRALAAALKAVLAADSRSSPEIAALAMTLAERAGHRLASTREPAVTSNIAALAARVRARFQQRAGRLRIACAAASRCEAELDGDPVAVNREMWVAVGDHRVKLTVDGSTSEQSVTVRAGEATPVTGESLLNGYLVDEAKTPDPGGPATTETAAPPTAQPLGEEPPHRDRSVSPVWFWASLGLTAAFVAGTVASGVDTKNKHDTFVETGELRIAGHSAQVRTNVLFGFTSALALATAGLGIFAVDWGDDEAPETARLSVGPAGLSVVGDF